jgi:DNA-binding NarL/FixJ family response regulator
MPTMPLVRIAIISDDGLYGDGVVRILASEVSFIPVAYVDVTELPPPNRAAHPHVIILDSRMAGALAICTTLAIAEGAAIIISAAPDDDGYAKDALSAGARGILTRASRAEELVQAVWSVRDGLIWARRRVMAARIDFLTRATSSAPAGAIFDARFDPRLSSREMEVFRYAASGLPNKELARRLDISEATVKAHMTHIFQKLGVRSRAELAAAYHGIVSVENEGEEMKVVRLKS